jgi:hypothetical protein
VRVSKLSSFNLGLEEEYLTRKFSKSKFLETSTIGRKGELDTTVGVLKMELGKWLEVPDATTENPS